MAQILFFIAEEGFRDEEYFEPKQILEEAGHVCDCVSTNDEMARGSIGAIVMPTTSLDTLKVEDYDAIIIVGGPGAKEMGSDFRVKSIIDEAFNKNKLIGAICIAPTILAKYGLIKGRIATCWKDAKEELESFDIIYKDDSVVVDTKKSPTLITANGPDSAIKFGEEINKFI